MRSRLLLFCILLSPAATFSWNFVGGSSSVNRVNEDQNGPGGRDQAITWAGPDMSHYVFGGYGYNTSGGALGYFNDLWRLSMDGTWQFVGGSQYINQAGSYGVRGVASLSNWPGARGRSTTWAALGLIGQFLMGGNIRDSTGASGLSNDLWFFNLATQQWTWIGGSDRAQALGVYGMLGIAQPENQIGCRDRAATWAGSGGQYLFGGVGYDISNSPGWLNDLWLYNDIKNEWTWIGGSQLANVPGNYGTFGLEQASNQPGGHSGTAGWNIPGGYVIFGGSGYDSTLEASLKTLNDMWVYRDSSQRWTWIGGSDIGDQPAVYGPVGVPSPTAFPGAIRNAFTWSSTDGNGQFIFGGFSTSQSNELWFQNFATKWWTYLGGSVDERGTYSAPGNPGAREKGLILRSGSRSTAVTAILGGLGYATGPRGYLNDIWFFNETGVPPVATTNTPTTANPTTRAATTGTPTTANPTTRAATTGTPTTANPTTRAATTGTPTTANPTTGAAATGTPTTANPTTGAATTANTGTSTAKIPSTRPATFTAPSPSVPSTISSQVVVAGNTTVTGLEVSDGGKLVVDGALTLNGGILVLELGERPNMPLTLTPLEYQSHSGSFLSVEALVPGLTECEMLVVEPIYGSNSMTVTVSVDSAQCSTLSTGAIAGIVIGGILLMLLIIALPLGLKMRSRNMHTAKKMESLEMAMKKTERKH